MRVDVRPVFGNRGEQRRQAGQRAVDLEKLAIDHAFNDQRGILKSCVRGMERGLPRAFKQDPCAADQAQHDEPEAKSDGPAEGASSVSAGSLKPVASGPSDRPIHPRVPFKSMCWNTTRMVKKRYSSRPRNEDPGDGGSRLRQREHAKDERP